MKPGRAAMLGVALIGAAYVLARTADQQAQAVAEEGGEGTALDFINPWGYVETQLNDYQAENAMRNSNIPAFLSLIEFSEGTNRGADPYRVCYGFKHTVQNMSDHPAATGEWKGESLDSLGAQYKGLVSTAAGRYQFILPTWRMCKRALNLPDFGPESQDKAAVYLITKRGALDAVEAGDIATAVSLCRQEWASLPGAGYGQPERKLAQLIDVFTSSGGQLA